MGLRDFAGKRAEWGGNGLVLARPKASEETEWGSLDLAVLLALNEEVQAGLKVRGVERQANHFHGA